MNLYVLTNGANWLLETGETGRAFEGSAPMYFNHMDEAGKELVKRPILVFMDYRPVLITVTP